MHDEPADHGPDAGLSGRDLIGLGGLLAGSVIVFTALGLLLDAAADSSPAFTLVGVALGIVAGGVGFWLRVRAALQGPARRG
jgi:F0F1-type ATP synthase assembly protein I